MNASLPSRDEEAVHRSPKVLLSAAGRGEGISPLSATEGRQLLTHASDTTRRFTSEICNRLKENDLRGARHKLHKMLASPSARLHALVLAERRRSDATRRTLEDLLSRIDDVDVFHRTASPRLTWKSKADGGQRPICKFGPEDYACSKLVSMALNQFARVHPKLACDASQTLLSGGSLTACERLREALQNAPQEAVFVQLDVKGFFQAINVEHLARITGLPPAVVHRHLSCDHMRLRQGERRSSLSRGQSVGQWPSAPHGDGCDEEEAVSGISQGSAASAAAAEMVMGSVLRDVSALEPVLLLVTYSDNIGVLVSSRATALAVTEVLRTVLENHEAGPFHIHQPSIRAVADGFNFLGYRWLKTVRGRVSISIPPYRLSLWELNFWDRVGDAYMSPDPSALLSLRNVVRGFAGSKSLWPGADPFRARMEARLFEHFLACCEAAAIDPYSLLPACDHHLLDEAADRTRERARRREAREEGCPAWRPREGPPELRSPRWRSEPSVCADTGSPG